MSALDPRYRRWLLWLAPFAVLALAIGLQTGWGSELRRAPPTDAPVAPAPVTTAVIPEYKLDAIGAMSATVDRPLFNATRRPAPLAPVAEGGGAMPKGKYVLTGTVVSDGEAIAFLRDAAGTGKGRSVKKGDAIDGMLVAEVSPERVRLVLGDESEDLELKVMKGPKTTIAAAPDAGAAPPPQAAGATAQAQGADAQPGAGRRAARGQGGLSGAPGSDAADNLRANRRAARQAQGAQQGSDGTQPPATQGGFDNTYRNMQRRNQK